MTLDITEMEINIVASTKRFFFELPFLKEFIPDLPVLDLRHIDRLTNSVGMVQHAKFSIPNYHHGYCLDDNARALQLMIMLYNQSPSEKLEKLIYTYLSYIQYMQLADGYFRNFLSFDNKYLDSYGTEDSFGRTVLALAVCCRLNKNKEIDKLTQELLHAALPHCGRLTSIRAIAYCILGISHYLEKYPGHKGFMAQLKTLVQFITNEYSLCATESWSWFEEIMSYDNAVIPLSLLRSYPLVGDRKMLQIAKESSNYLDKIVFRKGYLSTIGNKSWHTENKSIDTYDQQPIEIPHLILLYKEWYAISHDEHYTQKMLQTFQWYFGANDLKATLYNPHTAGCFDGLGRYEVNLNQGAESTLAFWTSYLYMTTPFS